MKSPTNTVIVEVVHGSLRTAEGIFFSGHIVGGRVLRPHDRVELPLEEARELAEQGIVSFEGAPPVRLIYSEQGKFRSDKPQRAVRSA